MSPISRQGIPQTSPMFCHYYGNSVITKTEDGPSAQPSSGFPQVPYNQWPPAINVSPQSYTGYNSTMTPGNNDTSGGSHHYSPGSTLIHQEFYQQYSYPPNQQATEQFSPCLYPCAYYNSPTSSASSSTDQADLSSCMNASMASVQPVGQLTMDSATPEEQKFTPINNKDYMGDNSPQHHNLQVDASHPRFYRQYQLNAVEKLSPTAAHNSTTSHNTSNCLVSENTDQDAQCSSSSGYQLPAIASIIDGCDSNNSSQCNTFQNTTIINQQNLIVWCT